MIFEIPEKFPNLSQSFKGVVDRGVLFLSRLEFIHCLFTINLSSILLHQKQPIARFFQPKQNLNNTVFTLNSNSIIDASILLK